MPWTHGLFFYLGAAQQRLWNIGGCSDADHPSPLVDVFVLSPSPSLSLSLSLPLSLPLPLSLCLSLSHTISFVLVVVDSDRKGPVSHAIRVAMCEDARGYALWEHAPGGDGFDREAMPERLVRLRAGRWGTPTANRRVLRVVCFVYWGCFLLLVVGTQYGNSTQVASSDYLVC